MKVNLIIPPLIHQRGDLFGSGVPYMSMEVPYIASYLREQGHQVKIVDGYGSKPDQFKVINNGQNFLKGLKDEEILERLDSNPDVLFMSSNAGLVSNYGIPYSFLMGFIPQLKQKFSCPLVITGNFATIHFKDFLDRGADYVLLAEYEVSSGQLVEALQKNDRAAIEKIDGIAFIKDGHLVVRPKQHFNDNLDALPFPAFDLMPLQNYWDLKYSHAPFQGKYLPLLTSRGCPLGCKFCFVPGIWGRQWKYRSAKNVADELQYFVEKFGVHDFQIEDMNPTVKKERFKELSKEILDRKLTITLKFAAGTKVETYDDETLEWMAKAGVNYISISPETGSPRLLKIMDKMFDHNYALERVKTMRRLGIYSQACFVLGYPGETPEDAALTERYIEKLADAGLDEVTLFIMSPVPGAPASTEESWYYENYEQLSFSPQWRKDFKMLSHRRLKWYSIFFARKFARRPQTALKMFANLFSKRFDTKSEMTAYRVLDTYSKLYLGS